MIPRDYAEREIASELLLFQELLPLTPSLDKKLNVLRAIIAKEQVPKHKVKVIDLRIGYYSWLALRHPIRALVQLVEHMSTRRALRRLVTAHPALAKPGLPQRPVYASWYRKRLAEHNDYCAAHGLPGRPA